jgi:hypothetical protein
MKLFSSNDRHLTHLKLEEVLADGTFPNAFCVEDYNAPEVYSVVSGLEELSQDQLSAAEALIKKLKG